MSSPAFRSSRLLLALAALVACGAPGTEDVFTRGNPKIAAAESGKAIAARPTPRLEFRQYRGYYRRLGEDSRFQPCGTATPLEITGTAWGRVLLQERFRWVSVEQGRRMFGVFQGAIVTDTLKPQGATGDSTAGTKRTTFFIVGVDSLRTWQEGDCGGMRVP